MTEPGLGRAPIALLLGAGLLAGCRTPPELPTPSTRAAVCESTEGAHALVPIVRGLVFTDEDETTWGPFLYRHGELVALLGGCMSNDDDPVSYCVACERSTWIRTESLDPVTRSSWCAGSEEGHDLIPAWYGRTDDRSVTDDRLLVERGRAVAYWASRVFCEGDPISYCVKCRRLSWFPAGTRSSPP